MAESKIDLLRHGEPAGPGYYRGITDDPLTQFGRKQMKCAVAGGRSWDFIISSPLVRCLEFASEFSAERRIPLIIEPGFQELDFGFWEGKTADEIEVLYPGAIAGFYSDPLHNAPYQGERFDHFWERVANTWGRIIDQYRQKRILIITHAGVIRVLIAQILEIPLKNIFRIQVDHGEMIRVSSYWEKTDVFYQIRLRAN